MSNRGEAPQVLANGVYVVSNGLMSDHWEKTNIYVTFYARVLADAAAQNKELNCNMLHGIFWKMSGKLPRLLPNTGISKKWKSYCLRLLFKVRYMAHDVPIF
jgi:uncharacterized protein with NRDE domain